METRIDVISTAVGFSQNGLCLTAVCPGCPGHIRKILVSNVPFMVSSDILLLTLKSLLEM